MTHKKAPLPETEVLTSLISENNDSDFTPPVRRMLCLARPGAQSSPLPEWVKVTVNGTPEDIDKGPFGRQAPHDKENHTSARVVGESWN